MYLLLFFSMAFSQDKTNAEIMATLEKSSQIITQEISKNRINLPSFRPKACPLVSVYGQDLYNKFKGIEEGLNAACLESNKTALNTLSTSINELDGIRKDYRKYSSAEDPDATPPVPVKPADTATPEEWTKYNTAVAERDAKIRQRGIEAVTVKNVSTALSAISDMTQNKDCKNSISREKVFTLISDIVIQTSSIGLLVPSSQGFMMAAGGIAVGSLLKILNELLKQEFDWSNRDARDTFLKMNCTFFDLKKEMDSVGLIHVKIEEHGAEIAKKRASIEVLEPMLTRLYQNEEKLRYKDRIINKSIVMGRMGEVNFRLLNNLDEARSMLEVKGPIMTNIESRADFLKSLYSLHGKIFSDLRMADVGKYGRLYYIEETKSEFMALLKGATNEEDFVKIYLKDMGAYKSLLDNFLTPLQWVYDYQKALERNSYIKAKGVQALVRSPLFRYRALITKYENVIDTYRTRIKFLNNLKNDSHFSPDDDGTRIRTNIIENFRGIEEKIYGKVGYTFNDYILKQVTKDFLSFDVNYKLMKDFDKVPQNLSEKDRMTYCANAKRLQLLWGSSHALLNLDYDFMETNKDSFFQPLVKAKMFIFIPYRRSDQQSLQDNAKSAFEAKAMLEKGDKDLKKLKKNSLGYHMVKLDLEKPKLINAQRFIDNNKCAK